MNEEVRRIVSLIGFNLQNLERLLQQNKIEKVNIRFPYGVIRKADHFRDRLSFIKDDTLRTNLAYHLMLTDLYRWILNRFDIALTAKEMLIKEGISLMGNIIEAVIRHTAKNLTGKDNFGFYKACSILLEHNIISKEQKKDLEWLWGMRCKQHIFTLPDAEYGKYNLKDYNRAILIWHDLEETLRRAKNRIRFKRRLSR